MSNAMSLKVRLAASAYKDKFVLKGGMLVAAIVGLDNRATMDLDTTLKNLPLTPEAIRSALEQVSAVPFDDGVAFELGKISPIREDDIYGGYRVMLNAHFDTLITPLSIDVSTGDAITPHAVQYQFSAIFDDEKSYELWAYNIETVMAEKVETILRRGVFNTRPRDFYDAYILATTQKFDKAVFAEALNATAAHRGTARQIADVPAILRNIESSRELKAMWEKYRKQFAYAAHIEYSQIMDVLKTSIRQNTALPIRERSFATTATGRNDPCPHWNGLEKRRSSTIIRRCPSGCWNANTALTRMASTPRTTAVRI